MSSEPQQTLARSASVSGTSLHTGEKVTLKLQPAPVDFGLKFRRKDLQEEPTIGDGSARPYVELIKKAGIVAQETPRRIFDVREPIHVETKNGSLLVVLPDPKFRISCTQAGPGGQDLTVRLDRH